MTARRQRSRCARSTPTPAPRTAGWGSPPVAARRRTAPARHPTPPTARARGTGGRRRLGVAVAGVLGRPPRASASTPGSASSGTPRPPVTCASRRWPPGDRSAAPARTAPSTRATEWSSAEMLEDLNGCPITLVDVGSLRDPDDVAEGEVGAHVEGGAAGRDRQPHRAGHRVRAERRRLRRGLALRRRRERAAPAGRGPRPALRARRAQVGVDPAGRAGPGAGPHGDRAGLRRAPGAGCRGRGPADEHPGAGQLPAPRRGAADRSSSTTTRPATRCMDSSSRSSRSSPTASSPSTCSSCSSGRAGSGRSRSRAGCARRGCASSVVAASPCRCRPSSPTSCRGGASRCRWSQSWPRWACSSRSSRRRRCAGRGPVGAGADGDRLGDDDGRARRRRHHAARGSSSRRSWVCSRSSRAGSTGWATRRSRSSRRRRSCSCTAVSSALVLAAAPQGRGDRGGRDRRVRGGRRRDAVLGRRRRRAAGARAGLVYIVLAVLGMRLTWRAGLLIGVWVVALFLAVAGADWLRAPSSRSHLGRFVQSIIDGNAMDIVIRKGQQNIDILLGNAPLTLLVPAALLFVIVVLARPTSWGSRALQRSYDQAPTLRAGLVALAHHPDDRLPRQRLRGGDPGGRRDPRRPAHRVGGRGPADRGGAIRGHDPRRTPAAMTTTQSTSPTQGTTPRRTPSVRSSTAGVIPSTRPGT